MGAKVAKRIRGRLRPFFSKKPPRIIPREKAQKPIASLPTKGIGGEGEMLFKESAKVEGIGEADGKGDLGDGIVGGKEELGGAGEAKI